MPAWTSRLRRPRRRGDAQQLDMNLVSLIDIFTILIFFLLSSAGGVELLSSPRPVKLPEARVEQLPDDAVVVVVAGDDILVQGRRVAGVAEALATAGADPIAPLTEALRSLPSPAGRPAPSGDVPAPRAVTLMADKDLPYRLLRRVMVSCAEASFGQVSFAVRQQLKVRT